jgi:polysaccharide biosynthesis/export protein
VTDREVIRVPLNDLKKGDLSYNIVIRPLDMIYVPSPLIGEYYMGGHVLRGGVYSLTARNITLLQAVIAAGGLDSVAIPARTEIIRRLSRDKQVFVRVDLERIAAGLEPDIYLKPDDQVRVGTNAGAQFLAQLRNAFRITYGFGFLYDRNYAPNNRDN